jgi:predicted CXXCH cytochrome family protein
MKKLMIFVVAIFLGSCLFGQISGSAHDFSGDAWNPSGEICIVCHTPHNADPYNDGIADAPLWNHDADMTTVYTLYSTSTLQATPGQPSGVSKLCLSCHDGVTALDSFGGATGTISLTSSDPGFLDTDLSDDHPISFTYNATTPNDPEIFDPTTTTTTLGGTIQADLLDGGTTMECSSCHDVHGTMNPALLKISNAGSQLCLTCHDK